VVKPIELYLAGRATSSYRGAQIPVSEVAVEAAKDWLRTHLTGLDVEHDVRIVPRLR
jgi:S-adenosylmethionine synthetase